MIRKDLALTTFLHFLYGINQRQLIYHYQLGRLLATRTESQCEIGSERCFSFQRSPLR